MLNRRLALSGGLAREAEGAVTRMSTILAREHGRDRGRHATTVPETRQRPTTVKPIALFAAVLTAALVGCSTSSPGGPTPGGPRSGTATGPGISVREALDSDFDTPVLVNGALFVSAGQVRLCSAIAESFPPQCGGDRIEVEGLELATIDGLQAEGGTSWAESVQLLGNVDNGVLVIAQAR